MAKEIYKFLHGLSPPTMKDILKVRGNINDALETLHRAKNIVRLGAEKITYRGCQIWNISPDNIKHVSSLENLKRRIKNWKGEKHSCRIVKHTRRIWDLPKQKRL